MRNRLTGLLALTLTFTSMPLLFADDGPTSKPATGEALPSAKSVIEKMITAAGGREAMEKLSSRVSSGEFEIVGMGIKAKFESFIGGPKRFRNIIDMAPLGKIEQGISGDVAWSLDPSQGARVLEGVEKTMSERGAHLNPLLHVETDYKSMKTVGRETIGDQVYLKLEFVSQDDQPETWYVDEDTHLRFRAEATIQAETLGRIKAKSDESDYREVDGVLIPHKMFLDQGAMKILITMKKVEHDTEIDPAIFNVPAEIQKLIDKEAERAKKKEAQEKEAQEKGAESAGTDG